MMHINRTSRKHSVFHAEPGLMRLDISSALEHPHIAILLGVIDEIATDLAEHKYNGKLTFKKDVVQIELNHKGESRTWEKVLPKDSDDNTKKLTT